MGIKIIIFLILGMSVAASVCFAQAASPSMGSQTSDTGTSATSTGVWPSVDSGSSAGYGSGDHGNVS